MAPFPTRPHLGGAPQAHAGEYNGPECVRQQPRRCRHLGPPHQWPSAGTLWHRKDHHVQPKQTTVDDSSYCDALDRLGEPSSEPETAVLFFQLGIILFM